MPNVVAGAVVLLILLTMNTMSTIVQASKLVYTLTPKICDIGYVVSNNSDAVARRSVDGNENLDIDGSSLVVLGWSRGESLVDRSTSSSSNSWNDSIYCAPSMGVGHVRTDTFPNHAALSSLGPFNDLLRSMDTVPDSAQSTGNSSKTDTIDTSTNNGLSLEIWIKPQALPTAPAQRKFPVLTIGTMYPNLRLSDGQATTNSSISTATSTSLLSLCEQEQFSFQLAVVNATWTVVYRVSINDSPASLPPLSTFDACRIHTLTPAVAWSKLAHIVVSLESQRQVVYVNGQTTFNALDSLDWNRDWDLDRYGMHVLGHPPVPPFDFASSFTSSLDDSLETSAAAITATASPTTMYQLTIHNAALNLAKVQDAIRQGLPPSRPFAYNQIVTVNEDAERIAGSHTTAWYRAPASPLRDDAALLRGPLVASLDREVDSMVRTLTMSGGNARRSNATLPPANLSTLAALAQIYLISLPSVGHLYWGDGTPLLPFTSSLTDTAVSWIVSLGTDPVSSLMYIPPHNVHSSVLGQDAFVTSFRYCVADVIIYHAEQCQSTATVFIHVAAVNDPPVATAVPVTVVREGLMRDHDPANCPSIALWGTDVDENDAIQAVEITQPPLLGDLILAVGVFRKDLLPHGTPVASLNFTIRGDDPVHVKYVSLPAVRRSGFNSIVSGSNNTKDSFMFRVQDKAGVWSLEEKVDIVIASAVSGAAKLPVVSIVEDLDEELRWSGNDASGYQRQLQFLVDEIPPRSVGVLWDAIANQALSSGTMLATTIAYPYLEEVALLFRPTANYCHGRTNPSEYDAQVRFRVAALERNSTTNSPIVQSLSDAVVQSFVVTCRHDALSLTLPLSMASVLETSLDRSRWDPCHGAMFHVDSVKGTATAAMPCDHALVVSGILIHSVDRRPLDWVLVSVTTRLGFLTFNAQNWNQTEPVVGRRVLASGRVVFYAHPDDLTFVLDELHYQSFQAGSDSIDLELRYGQDCTVQGMLSQSYTELNATCQVVRASIAVKVLKDEDKYRAHTTMVVGFPWEILFCLLAYPLLYAAVVLVQATLAGDHDDHDAETVVEGSPLEPVERYIQHEDEHGMFYYEDTHGNTVRWDLPPGEDFVHFEDIGQ
jgi:hypothetical protein